MSSPIKVHVEGLREFTKAVDAAEKGLRKHVRLALNESVDLVIDETEPGVPTQDGTAVGSIRAVSTQSKARVRAGGARAPHYPWLDFGGRVGKFRQVHRDYTREGRYLYPTYRSLRDSGEFQDKMVEALVKLGDRAGLEVKGG